MNRRQSAMRVTRRRQKMKTQLSKWLCSLISLFLACFSSQLSIAQEGFRNLNFEGASTNSLSSFSDQGSFLSGWGPTRDLLPFWRMHHLGSEVNTIFFNALALDGGGVSIISQDGLSEYSFVFPKGIEGEYALSFSVNEFPFTLIQVDRIPDGARLLEIDASFRGGAKLEARINGELIENGNISRFAGQIAELQLALFYERPSFGEDLVGLNRIGFVVPEPRTIASPGIGFAWLLVWVAAGQTRNRPAHADTRHSSRPVTVQSSRAADD